MLKSFVEIFTEEFPEGVVWKKDNKYFLVKEIPKLKPFYAGIYLGALEQKFYPSSWLLEWVSKRTKQKVYVDDKGEWMFICGKDIYRRSWVRKRKIVSKDGTVLVMNVHDECLGYGVFQDRKRIAVRNIFDIGDFLRRERPFLKNKKVISEKKVRFRKKNHW